MLHIVTLNRNFLLHMKIVLYSSWPIDLCKVHEIGVNKVVCLNPLIVSDIL